MIDEADERLEPRAWFEPVVRVECEPVERRQQRAAYRVEISRPANVLDDRGANLGERLGRLGVDLREQLLRRQLSLSCA